MDTKFFLDIFALIAVIILVIFFLKDLFLNSELGKKSVEWVKHKIGKE